MKINEKLIKLREAHNFTQNDIAKQLFVTRQAVYKWERGENYPDIGNLQKLAEIYSISLDDLLNDTITLEQIYNKRGETKLLDEKSKKNLITYVKMFPLIGVLLSAFSFIYFFGIQGIREDVLLVTLYCLMPLGVLMFLYVPYRVVIKRIENEKNRASFNSLFRHFDVSYA